MGYLLYASLGDCGVLRSVVWLSGGVVTYCMRPRSVPDKLECMYHIFFVAFHVHYVA